MADISPIVPAGRQVIESYGGGGFRISGVRHAHSVLVLPDATIAWPVAAWDQIEPASLLSLGVGGGEAIQPRTLLIGTGTKQHFPDRAFRARLRAAGLVVETMDTGAACRTYNVLMAEGRDVAAALIAIA
jgi:uncharacterized protein